MQEQIVDRLAAQTIANYASSQIKFHCYQRAGEQLNNQFQECYKRLSQLNYRYYTGLMQAAAKQNNQQFNIKRDLNNSSNQS